MIIKENFEATYPHYAFAPLVHMGIAIAAYFSSRSRNASLPGAPGSTVGGALGSAA